VKYELGFYIPEDGILQHYDYFPRSESSFDKQASGQTG
jgi:hypothetical protein